jgi:hypothetical protein
MGFFGFVFWVVVLWLAFRWWQRREGKGTRGYGPYTGWYDSGEFDGRRHRKRVAPQPEVEDQQLYIDTLERRVTELEERLDFTERLLADRQPLVNQQ